MPVFLERYVLPILVAFVIGVCVFNPWKWDLHQRISLFLGMTFLAYFFAYTSHRSKPQTTANTATTQAIESPQRTGDATANGNHSIANTGNGNTIDQSSPPEKKPPNKE